MAQTCLDTSSTYCTMSLVLTQWLHVLPRATTALPTSELEVDNSSVQSTSEHNNMSTTEKYKIYWPKINKFHCQKT